MRRFSSKKIVPRITWPVSPTSALTIRLACGPHRSEVPWMPRDFLLVARLHRPETSPRLSYEHSLPTPRRVGVAERSTGTYGIGLQ